MFVRLFYDHVLKKNQELCFCEQNKCCRAQIATICRQKCGNIFDDYFQKKCVSNDDCLNAKINLFEMFSGIGNCECSRIRASKLCVVLHGWGADSSLYEKLCLGICSNFDLVVAPDMIGFGLSPDLQNVWKTENFVCLLERLIDLFDFDELTLVGHSFGGKTILFWIEKNKANHDVMGRLKKVVLISPSGVKPKFSLAKKIKIFRYKRLKKKCKKNPKLMKKLSKFGSNDYKSINDGNLKKTFLNVVNEHFPCGKNHYDLNVLLIFGSRDRETPPFMGKVLESCICGANLKIIKGAGHFSFLDCCETVLRMMNDFFMS